MATHVTRSIIKSVISTPPKIKLRDNRRIGRPYFQFLTAMCNYRILKERKCPIQSDNSNDFEQAVQSFEAVGGFFIYSLLSLQVGEYCYNHADNSCCAGNNCNYSVNNHNKPPVFEFQHKLIESGSRRL